MAQINKPKNKQKEEIVNLANKIIPHNMHVVMVHLNKGDYAKADDQLKQVKTYIKELEKQLEKIIYQQV